MKIHRTKFIISFMMAYVLLACTWWAYLLYSKNGEVFELRVAVLRNAMQQQESFDEATFHLTDEYLKLKDRYDRQSRMVLGEALVFFVFLSIGIWVVTRGLRREVALARQQRNFLLSITHELKSPIAGIQLVMETFLLRTLKEEQIKRLAGNALQDAKRLFTLVSNLLFAAKIENQYQWVQEEVNLKDLLTQLMGNIGPKNPNIIFNTEVDYELNPIIADRVGITSVMLNLVENAVKYGAEGKEIHVKLLQQKDRILFEVKDFGAGVKDKDKERIFEKFYRVGNEDQRKTKGTGLGLFIVRRIVQAHYGQVFVKDNLPKGSVFQVWLPIKAPSKKRK